MPLSSLYLFSSIVTHPPQKNRSPQSAGSEVARNHPPQIDLSPKTASRGSCGAVAACYVRPGGLEPPRPKTLDPKSNAATNYATGANVPQRYDFFLNCRPLCDGV